MKKLVKSRKTTILAIMPRRRPTLCIDDYDCIGFDLDHTLCRYNVGNLVRLVYELLSDYLVSKKGYDISIKNHSLDADLNLVAKGLTLGKSFLLEPMSLTSGFSPSMS